ncbi:MAG: hypothetical protein ACHQUC_07905 [Chlamydiales bacterium]
MENFNYSLDKENYTLKNALLWGNFYGHCSKAMEGKLSSRTVVHVLIALIEFIPGIGQIASIFELVIIIQFDPAFNKSIEDLSNKKILLLTKKPIPENALSFEDFREKVLSELPEYIKSQQEHPSYKRARLVPLDEDKLNKPIALRTAPEGIEYFANRATFYGYNAEGIADYQWGCAWRTIQTCLSAYDIEISFEEMFHLFGQSKHLEFLYSNKYPDEVLRTETKFAPHDLETGWAEPFIGEMAMHFYHLSSNLERINGFPRHCHAPREVFHHQVLGFQTFKEQLKNHFEKDNPAPIMIDDGTYALTIVGIGSRGSETKLWIADPHIMEGVNRLPSEKSPAGLYTVTLNDTGRQIDSSLRHEDFHQVAQLPYQGSYQGLHFENKPWMVLFPDFKDEDESSMV